MEDEDLERKNSHQKTADSERWKTLADGTDDWQTLPENADQAWDSVLSSGIPNMESADELDDPSQEIEIRIDAADDDDGVDGQRDPLTEDLYCDDEFQETNLVNANTN